MSQVTRRATPWSGAQRAQSCSQGNELAARLAADDKAGTLPKALYNVSCSQAARMLRLAGLRPDLHAQHYTVITAAKDGYDQVAYATFFHKEVGAVISVFDAWLAGAALAQMPPSPELC